MKSPLAVLLEIGEMYDSFLSDRTKVIAVAPMMDWTDRHCRFLHRQLSKHSLLYTEMVVAEAIIRGDRQRLLGFDAQEHPVAVQLGGSDPDRVAEAARIAADFGYDEINLNVGCPSDRVQSGTFGACLMREPELVARCVLAMKQAVAIPVTVKCRLGVDDQDIETALDELADRTLDAGVDGLWVHARKAWLEGLSPKENRDIPPLDYGRVLRLKQRLPQTFVGINGGITNLVQAHSLLDSLDGVMIGRSAYHNATMLAGVDHLVDTGAVDAAAEAKVDWSQVRDAMMQHADQHMRAGGRLIHVTRHMVGLFQGYRGARRYRQILSTNAVRKDATTDVIAQAFAAVELTDAAEPVSLSA